MSSADVTAGAVVSLPGERGRSPRAYGRTLLWLAARLARLVATFLLVTLGTALMLNLVPGSPAVYMAGEGATPSLIRSINAQYHFNEPVLARYWHWLTGFLHGDLGISYATKQPVETVLGERAPVTIELALLATVLAIVVALAVALLVAQRPGGWLDRIVSLACSSVIALPSFVVALVLVYLLAYKAKVFPTLGWTPLDQSVGDNLRCVVLPVVSIAAGEAVVLTRVLRADLVDAMGQDYVALARTKGLSNRAIVWRHALPPASLTLLTLSGLTLARLLGGTVVVESIFVLPGIGALLLQSIQAKDLVMVQGIVASLTVVFLLLNFLVDLLYGLIDPRMRTRA